MRGLKRWLESPADAGGTDGGGRRASTSGFLDFLSGVLAGPAAFLHIPAQVVPLLLVRLVSSSAATGLLLDILKRMDPIRGSA